MVATSPHRLTKEQWLSLALDVLARNGSTALSLNNLIKHLHVTKGSFYWHFKNQADFQFALIDHWHETHTLVVANKIDGVDGGPETQLRSLMKMVITERHVLFDGAITALTIQNPDLRPKVQASYDLRIAYVRKCFSALGFRGKELSARTRMFVAFMTSEPLVNAGLSIKQRVAQIPVNLSLLTDRR